MAVPSGSSNLTPTERTELDSWGFVKSYTKHRGDLLDLAKPIYTLLCRSLSNQAPTRDEFCRFYGDTLRLTNLYVKRIARKKYYLPLSLYDHFAELLAKYAVERDWGDISSAPCP